MSITLDQIKKLRERTGVSATSCKKALEESGGDEEKAIELLRKKGETKAAERADRLTANGVVAIAKEGDKAAIVTLACETDFVAKNADFINSAQKFAEKILKEGEKVDLSKEISDLTIQLGEKIEIKEKKIISGKKISHYVHSNNKIGVLVSFSGGDESICRDIAMHIAAMNPKNISPEEISAELVAKEKEIWAEQLKQEGKPMEMIEKIMLGKEKKFREEFALLTQPFVKNPEQLIRDLLGANTVVEFWRFEV